MNMNTRDWIIEGQQAYVRGKDLEDCPYDYGTEPYNAWRKGWLDMAEEYEDD